MAQDTTVFSIDELARELYAARVDAAPVPPLTQRFPAITVEDAYRIQLAMMERRCAENALVVIGKKIGVTSQPVMDMFGVNEPDFGFLTSDMALSSGSEIATATLIAPKVEGEIAFLLGADLVGPGITEDDVIAATRAVLPCLEVVDSRIADWKIRIQDTVADNASSALVVLGADTHRPDQVDLIDCAMTLEINGEVRTTGKGSATMGHPARAVAWLANTLSAYGITLKAGEVILSGSMGAMLPVAAGDHVRMTVAGMGAAEVRFA